MEQLVTAGKISYVGSSNFAAWDVALAQSAATSRHFIGLTSDQSLYNLAVRAVEMEMIPALRALGIGLLPYSPLNAGLLAGARQAADEGRVSEDHCDGSTRTATNSRRTSSSAATSALHRHTSRWLGCCITPSCPARSSARSPSTSSMTTSTPSPSTSTTPH